VADRARQLSERGGSAGADVERGGPDGSLGDDLDGG
jgi:hypothetical protein